MPMPVPTPIYRLIHIDNLPVVLRRGALHAPNHVPGDGLPYRTIHNVDIQRQRRATPIPRGPGGFIHDYVPFYFGPRSPMLYQLHTGWVEGYDGGQEPLLYLVSTVEKVARSGIPFVFSDGHGIAAYTRWYDDLAEMVRVDWNMVYNRSWRDTVEDMDRQRRKQAEFMVYHSCDWALIEEIGTLNTVAGARIEAIFARFSSSLRRPVRVHTDWYY